MPRRAPRRPDASPRRPRPCAVERLEDRTLLTLDFGFAQGLGGTGILINGTAVDAAGNVYASGDFQGTVDFDPRVNRPDDSDIRSTSGGLGDTDAFVAKYAPDGTLLWVRTAGGAFSDSAFGVGVDAAGNVYAAGFFTGNNINFGNGQVLSTPRADIFVWKLDPNGVTTWAKGTTSAAGLGSNQALSLDVRMVGGSPKVAITGFLSNSGNTGGTGEARPTSFPTGGAPLVLTPTSAQETLVARLDGDTGNFEWARLLPMTPGSSGIGARVALAPDGTVVSTGVFSGTVDLDPGPGARAFTSTAGSGDAFVSKLDAAGNFAFGVAYGGNGADWGHGVAVDGAGTIFVVGRYQGTVDFDRDVVRPGGADMLTAPGLQNGLYLLRLAPNGQFGWVRDLGVNITNAQVGQAAVAVTGAATVLVAGSFQDTVNFGGNSLTSAGGSDIFLATVEKSAGAILEATRAGGAGVDAPRDLAAFSGGPAALVGDYVGPANFGVTSLPDRGNDEGFVARVIAAGPRTPSGGITIVDFDGNGVTDLGVFAPATAQWTVQTKNATGGTIGSRNGVWGAPGNVTGWPLGEFPVPGDYDGNGVTDRAVFNSNDATYKIEYLNAAGNVIGTNVFQFGFPGWYAEALGLEPMQDLPIPGDYDGNGVTDLAVFRVDTAEWIIKLLDVAATPGRPGGIDPRPVAQGGNIVGNRIRQFGTPGWFALAQGREILEDIPVPGDYDGNGVTDFAVYRRATGEWLAFFKDSAGNDLGSRVLGTLHDRTDVTAIRNQGNRPVRDAFPIPGDYDGNGVTDLALWDAATADWRIVLLDASGVTINRTDDGASNTRRQVFGAPGNPSAGSYPNIPLHAPFSSLIKLRVLPGLNRPGGSGAGRGLTLAGGTGDIGGGRSLAAVDSAALPLLSPEAGATPLPSGPLGRRRDGTRAL